MNKYKVSLILKVGVGLLLIGTIIPGLLVVIFQVDSAVGPIIIAYVTFWPSIGLILIGAAKTIRDSFTHNKN